MSFVLNGSGGKCGRTFCRARRPLRCVRSKYYGVTVIVPITPWILMGKLLGVIGDQACLHGKENDHRNLALSSFLLI